MTSTAPLPVGLRLPELGRLKATTPVDGIANYYAPGIGAVLRRRLQWVREALPARPVRHALEIGYGSGVFEYELARRAEFVVGIDMHDQGASVRERLAADDVHVTLLRGDGMCLPFADASFDVVVILSALEFMVDPAACLRESARVLCQGGRLICVRPRPLAWADAVYHFLTHVDPEADFVGGRARVQAALDQVVLDHTLPGLRRHTRPAWMADALAPYELVTFDRVRRLTDSGPSLSASLPRRD